ncbi:type IVB secretion system protein IcmH/DotU [Legionella sp. D16C41]|uniref:type IVB secretion system protein IcmH/DotU n=1 Tax=Legionella sp. D16C41 TaxID=3402688 RepID=UPI003AF4E749
MTAGHMSASFARRLPLVSGNQQIPKVYYRSKLFTISFTTNPLVAAAGPLLSLVERLSISPSLPPVQNIRENIEHELRAFHSRLDGKAYTEEFDAIAHYLLCATMDELLGKSYLRLHGRPAEFQAFTPLSYDGIGPEEHFFNIVNHIKENPNQYLDLIELAYYCLIAGFEGKQHQRADGRLVLDNMIEELFQLIQQHRVNKPCYLFKETRKMELTKPGYKSMLIISLSLVGVLLTSYITSYFLIDNKARAVQFGHAVIAKLDD